VNVRSLLLSQYQRVSDGHTDMPPMPYVSRSIIAKSDKNDRPILLVEDEG